LNCSPRPESEPGTAHCRGTSRSPGARPSPFELINLLNANYRKTRRCTYSVDGCLIRHAFNWLFGSSSTCTFDYGNYPVTRGHQRANLSDACSSYRPSVLKFTLTRPPSGTLASRLLWAQRLSRKTRVAIGATKAECIGHAENRPPSEPCLSHQHFGNFLGGFNGRGLLLARTFPSPSLSPTHLLFSPL